MTAPAVLVIEDDRQLVGLLQELLGEAGFEVEIAPNGQAGLHLALTRRYDVLLVDRGLPVMEGIEVLRRLRDRGIATPALVLTARGTFRTFTRDELLDDGPDRLVAENAARRHRRTSPLDPWSPEPQCRRHRAVGATWPHGPAVCSRHCRVTWPIGRRR